MAELQFRSELFEFAESYIDKNAELDPFSATMWGIDRYDDRLNDFSIEHSHAVADHMRSSLRALEEIRINDDIDRVGHALMVERLSAQLALEESGEQRRTFSAIWSPATQVRGVFDLQPAENAEHADRIRARLDAVKGALDSWRGALDEDSAGGLTPARRHPLLVADQLDVYSSGGFQAPAGQLAQSCGVDVDEAGLAAAGAEAAKACGELAAWLRDVYAPRAHEEDAAGPERYAQWARYFTGAELDLDEIYDWGWDDLKRINARMWDLARMIAPDAGSLAEVAASLDADESRAIHGTEELLERLRALTEGAVEMLDGTHFDIDDRIRFCDARLAPEGSASAPYYFPPSEDLSRPGTTWYPTFGHDRFPIWRDVTTWYHESVPGHHLQCATSILEKDRQTRFQRLSGDVSGYSEGWALYAERLMDELGGYEDPAAEMGHLAGQAWRAVRIVVDIGMHLRKKAPADIGELGPLADAAGRVWNHEMAVALLMERAIAENDKAVSEVDRYLGLPGQAISYKVGERVWLECRADARSRLGPAFDLKAWHAHALRLGPLGLDPFRAEMAAYTG